MTNHQLKDIILFFFIFIPFFGFSQNFSLEGDFEGSKTNELILSYFNKENKYIQDTLSITNNKFQTSGTIYGVQRAIIKSDISEFGMEDPNLGYFFIEPGNLKLELEENKFKDLKVVGSKTQLEYNAINEKTTNIHREIDSISKLQLNNSRELIIAKHDKIKAIELQYAYENPDSKLSPYYVDFYQRAIPLDSLKNFYNSFSESNKNSISGVKIKDLIEKQIPKSSDRAPSFEYIDMEGKPVTLDSFKGDYLLIDFWAGWCVPCVKNLPELKSLHQKYNKEGLEILGVSFDRSKKDWKKGVANHEIASWKQIYVGLDNVKEKGSISEKFDIQPIPAYILIDKEGKIIDRYLNASSDDKNFNELTMKIEQLFK